MDSLAPNYLLFASYVAACLILGILSNFIKPIWSATAYFLLFYIGVFISSGSSVWSEGFLKGIWIIISQGWIYLLLPFALLAGATYFIGRYGYRFLEKMIKKSERE